MTSFLHIKPWETLPRPTKRKSITFPPSSPLPGKARMGAYPARLALQSRADSGINVILQNASGMHR